MFKCSNFHLPASTAYKSPKLKESALRKASIASSENMLSHFFLHYWYLAGVGLAPLVLKIFITLTRYISNRLGTPSIQYFANRATVLWYSQYIYLTYLFFQTSFSTPINSTKKPAKSIRHLFLLISLCGKWVKTSWFAPRHLGGTRAQWRRDRNIGKRYHPSKHASVSPITAHKVLAVSHGCIRYDQSQAHITRPLRCSVIYHCFGLHSEKILGPQILQITGSLKSTTFASGTPRRVQVR